MLASSGNDQTIKLWNVADGKLIRDLKGHTGIVDTVAFSPDGKQLASGSADKSVRLWNPSDGKAIKTLGTHGNSVYAVAFSPDGKWLASAGAAPPAGTKVDPDVLVKIWDVAGQKEHKAIKGGHELAATGVVFAPDSQTLYSIGFDRNVRVWTVADGKEVKKLGPTPDDLYGIAFSRDGKDLVTSGYGGNVTVWNLAEGKPAWTKKLKFGAYCVLFTPDGKAVITGHDNHICYITPVKAGQ